MRTVRCSLCAKELEYLGGLEQMFKPSASVLGAGSSDPFEQWRGNVCSNCRHVFCPDCIEVGGPTPCPKCGQPTEPAQRAYLEQIGKL